MDYSKKFLSPYSQFGMASPTPSDSRRRTHGTTEDTEETNENIGHLHEVFGPRSPNLKQERFMSPTISSASKNKRILAEKNDGPISDSVNSHFKETPQAKSVMGLDRFDAPRQIAPRQICNGFSSDSSPMAPYDPVTNYTSPRPEFLRYNPNRRREILLCIEGETRDAEEGLGVDLSLSSDPKKPSLEESSSMSPTSPTANSEEGDPDAEDDDMEDKEMEVRPWYCTMVWKSVLLFGLLLSSFYCISSHEGEGLQESHLKAPGGGTLLNASDLNKFPQNFMEIIMGLSEKCVDVHREEFTCGNGGVDCNSRVPHDLIRREDLEMMQTYTGISRFHSGDQTAGDEDIGSGLLMSDNKREMEAGFDSEIVTDGVQEMLIHNENLNGYYQAIGERSEEEASSSNDFVRKFVDEDSEKYENVGPDSMDAGNVQQILFVSDNPPTNHDTEFNLRGSFETDGSRQEAENLETGEITEFFWETESSVIPHVVVEHQTEAFNTPAISESDSVSHSGYVLQLLYPLIYVLMAMVGSIFVVYKVSMNSYKKLPRASPLPPASPLPSEAAIEEKITSVVEMNGDMENKGGGGFTVSLMPLNDSRDGNKFDGIQPPKVQLLGEFSIFDAASGSETVSHQELTRRGADSAEESSFSTYQRKKSVRKKTVSSDSKASPSPVESSFLAQSPSTVRKPLTEEDNGDGGETVKKVFSTPLRRSSRLRNRVTSP